MLTIRRVTKLLERDAELGDRRAAQTLEDAAALSFLALGSDRLADAEGRAAARFAVDATLRTMSRGAREKLASVRLRPDILHFLFESVAA